MKRFLIPALLFVAVFLVTWLCLPYTLMCMEYETYGRVILQFFRYPVYGALIVAFAVTLVYVLLAVFLPKKARIPVAAGMALAFVLVVLSPA